MTQLENKENSSEKQIVSKENLDESKSLEKKNVRTEVHNGLKIVEANVVENETKQMTDQLKNEIDKNKYEKLPLQTYNEIVK
jgi:hypothetical protein